jgi:hypothetical protein
MCLVVYFDSTAVVKFTRTLLLFKTFGIYLLTMNIQPLPLRVKTPTDISRVFSLTTYAVSVNYYIFRP